jgi:DNA polymerase I
MIRMDAPLDAAKLRAKMLLQVRDELVFEAPERDVEAKIALVRAVMKQAALPAVSLSVPLLVEARAVDSWDEAH